MATDRYTVQGVFDDQISGPAATVVEMFTDLEDAAGTLADRMKRLSDDILDSKGWTELDTRLDSLLDNVTEFGGSLEDQRNALKAVDEENKRTGKSIALISNALRTMTDESEDAAGAQRNLGLAMDLASAKMIKTEDAGRLLGRVMRGDVTALNELGPAAKRAADAIAKIEDPAERARLGLQVIQREAKGVQSNFAGMQRSLAGVDRDLSAIGLPAGTAARAVGAVGVAAVAATAALGKFALDGLQKAIAKSGEMSNQVTILSANIDRYQIAVGKAIAEQANFAQILSDVNAILGTTADSADAAAGHVDTLGDILKGMAGGVLGPLGAIASQFISIGDAASWASGQVRDLKRAMGGDTGPSPGMGNRGLKEVDSWEADQRKADYARQAAKEKRTRASRAANRERRRKAEAKASAEFADVLSGAGATSSSKGSSGGGSGKPKDLGISMALEGGLIWGEGVTGGAGSGKALADIEARIRLREQEAEIESQAAERRIAREKEQADARKRDEEANRKLTEQTQALEQEYAALAAIGTGAFDSLISGTFAMVDALAMGELKLKDIGSYLGGMFGDILASAGQQLAEHAIKQGAVYALFGEAMTALAAGSPGAAIVAGLALVAAGTALKAFTKAGGGGNKARGADNRAAGAVERLGRDIIGRTQDAARPVYISIEGRTMRGYTTDVMNDAMRRGQVVVTPRRV